MKVWVAGNATIHDLRLAVLHRDHGPPAGVVGEFHPGNMTGFWFSHAALAGPRHPDAFSNMRYSLPRSLDVSIEDLRLLNLRRERPGD